MIRDESPKAFLGKNKLVIRRSLRPKRLASTLSVVKPSETTGDRSIVVVARANKKALRRQEIDREREREMAKDRVSER